MDKPKTTIKKPALYKMVSFKGVDKSASKETKDMNEGLKVNLSAVNSLGATVNSLSIVANKMAGTMKEIVDFQISERGITERYRKRKDEDEKRERNREVVTKKKVEQREKRDEAADVKKTSNRFVERLGAVTKAMFGGFFQTFAKIAEWLFSGIVKFAIFDFLMKNPEKVKRLAMGLYQIGKWAFGVISFLGGSAASGLIKFLENPLSLKGFFGVMQFALSLAPLFAGFAILSNPLAALKGIKAVVGMLFGMVKNLMKAGKIGGRLKKFAGTTLGGNLLRGSAFGGAAYATARLAGMDQAEAIGTGIGAGAGSQIGGAIGAATGIPGGAMLGQAAGAFVGGAAGGGIAKAMEPIITPFKQFFAQVGEVFSAIFTPIQEAAGDFFKALGGAFSAVLDFIEPAMPTIKKVGAFFGTVAFAPLIGLMKALTFVLGFFAGGSDKDKAPKKEVAKKQAKEVKTTTKKQVSGRFDMDTGKAYINDKEVSTDEYVAYYNMSRAEKLANYGVEPKAEGGIIVVPEMAKGGEAADLGEASQDSDVNGALGNVLGYMKKMVGLLKEGDGGGGWLNPNNWFAGGGKLGGWINGPQSGYPVSLDGGKSTSFIGHGLEWVGYPKKATGGSAFIVPFNTPKTKSNAGLTGQRMKEAANKGYALPFAAGGEYNSYQELIAAGGTVDDVAAGDFRAVTIYGPWEYYRTGFLGLKKGKRRMKNTFYTDGNYQDAQMPIADYVNMKMGWDATNAKATITKKDDVKKNLRGSGAKDRGREGGNFSGDQQDNERGEYAFKNRENTRKISPYKKTPDPRDLEKLLNPVVEKAKDIKDFVGDKINEYRIQENAELQKMVTESNAAMASAIEQQNTAVSTMANANMDGGGVGQPEDIPIITPNFFQWNEADPFFVSKFDQFRSTKPDMHCTHNLK